MISIAEAEHIVKSSSILLESESLELLNSIGYYLSEDIFSPMQMPPFSQSAMDGYAVCGTATTFTVVGEIQAGDSNDYTLKTGEAYRIFTGAMIPEHMNFYSYFIFIIT